MVYTSYMLDKQGYMYARTYMPTRPGTRTNASTHTKMCNTYCFSTATMIRERASMLGYTYIACHDMYM